MSKVKKKEEKENPYKDCILFQEKVCGPFKRWDRDGIFKADDLEENVGKHFSNLKVKYVLFCRYCFFLVGLFLFSL